jgi:hypothetical protein
MRNHIEFSNKNRIQNVADKNQPKLKHICDIAFPCYPMNLNKFLGNIFLLKIKSLFQSIRFERFLFSMPSVFFQVSNQNSKSGIYFMQSELKIGAIETFDYLNDN